MASYNEATASDVPVPPTWMRLLLGIVMIGAGILVLGDVVLASLISAKFIGAMAMVAGAYEIVHAFWTKGWGGFIWQLVLGVLYLVFGFTIFTQPAAGALALTFVLGLILVGSGAVRIFLALRYWGDRSLLMLVSGVFGVIAGLIILSGWPITGLWVIGLLLGFDLIIHGAAWITYGLFKRA